MSWRTRLLDRWVEISLAHPWRILAVGAAMLAVSVYFASRLGLKSDFIELLPTDSPSVVNLEHLKERVSSYSTLTVAVQSPDLESSQRFAEDLVARLKTFPPERIRFIDYNTRELREFYNKNKFLYAELPDLTDFRDRLAKRIQEETEAGVVESLDDEETPRTDLKIDELKAKYEKKASTQDRYPGGFYVTPDRSLLAIFLRPPPGGSGFEASQALVRDVQAEVDRLDPSKYHPRMRVGFTGEVKTGIEEYEALADDMLFITGLCILMIMLSLVLYYRSFRSIFLVGTPVLLGISMSFAVAWLAIGYLNSATAFLSSIIAGNGINFMIMLAARFYEEIRVPREDGLAASLKEAVLGTAHGTIAAAGAASIAYGSLVVAGFRGFRQFGLIGGVGMILCWLVTFLVGPALIVVFHRWRPLGQRGGDHHFLSPAVARLVTSHPRWILSISLLLGLGALAVTLPWAAAPFEYDFHNLRNRISATRGSAKLSRRVDRIFDLPPSPTPLLVNSVEDAPRIQRKLLDAPGAEDVIGDVKTLFDFLPKQQEDKLAVLAQVRKLIDKKIDFLSDKDQKTVLEYRPPEELKVVGVDDIPEAVARPFTESDGTRGRILYAYSKPGNSLLNGRYLLKFARFIRGQDGGGSEFIAVGQPLIFADMVTAVLHDGVKVTVACVAGVLALLLMMFRSRRGVGVILAAVVLGTLWMVGIAAVFGMKVNFLNFVVLPITLGIAVDYGANIYSRYRAEGPGRMGEVITSTGGAVFLASLTTIIGYATLITSTNMALQSFGIVADIGEITTLIAAEISMCALIVWLERKNDRFRA
jgi:predicted RND superfamily exporter protein